MFGHGMFGVGYFGGGWYGPAGEFEPTPPLENDGSTGMGGKQVVIRFHRRRKAM